MWENELKSNFCFQLCYYLRWCSQFSSFNKSSLSNPFIIFSREKFTIDLFGINLLSQWALHYKHIYHNWFIYYRMITIYVQIICLYIPLLLWFLTNADLLIGNNCCKKTFNNLACLYYRLYSKHSSLMQISNYHSENSYKIYLFFLLLIHKNHKMAVLWLTVRIHWSSVHILV